MNYYYLALGFATYLCRFLQTTLTKHDNSLLTDDLMTYNHHWP